MIDDPNILVLGLGTLLRGDEGMGVYAAQALLQGEMPPGVTVLDLGTAAPEDLFDLEKAEFVIALDAVQAGGEPGTVYRMFMGEQARPEFVASMHGFELSAVLGLTGKQALPVLVIGVEPASIDWSVELSPKVIDALPKVIEQVWIEIGARRSRWHSNYSLTNIEHSSTA